MPHTITHAAYDPGHNDTAHPELLNTAIGTAVALRLWPYISREPQIAAQ